jgi:hypothetical protein
MRVIVLEGAVGIQGVAVGEVWNRVQGNGEVIVGHAENGAYQYLYISIYFLKYPLWIMATATNAQGV